MSFSLAFRTQGEGIPDDDGIGQGVKMKRKTSEGSEIRLKIQNKKKKKNSTPPQNHWTTLL